MNVLLFDLENGSKTLGNKEFIKDRFNLPVLAPSTFNQFQLVLGQLYQQETVQVVEKIGGLEISDEQRVLKLKDPKLKVDAVVIDTVRQLH